MVVNHLCVTHDINPARHYQRRRIAHWDRVADKPAERKRAGAFYHRLLERYYRFYIPSGLKVLELGCGNGDLLAAVEPSFGVGVDFSARTIAQAAAKHPLLAFIAADAAEIAFNTIFDVVILSDLVNDLWDLQTVLDNLHTMIRPESRIVLNYFNNLWRIPLSVLKRLDMGFDVLEQNWFSPHDIVNILNLTGFEVIKSSEQILTAVNIPFLSNFMNRYLSHVVPFSWLALTNFVIARIQPVKQQQAGVSVIIPARNEAGNIEQIIRRTPKMGTFTELIFVEGGSADNTYQTITEAISRFPHKQIALYQQSGKGKGDAVRCGFAKARGDILMILDADMTVPPEDLTRFYDAIVSGKGEFINGVRLVYPMEEESMRFINMLGNKFFSLAFSWLLGQPLKDTLCGTKVIWKIHYQSLVQNRHYFGEFDPFGDFDLLFGAAKLNLKIMEIPIRYRSRTYGETNIKRWSHGWMLLKMVLFAARRIKFIG